MDVIRNPESTKKRSTPTQPMTVRSLMKSRVGCSVNSFARLKICRAITSTMAIPRRPSSSLLRPSGVLMFSLRMRAALTDRGIDRAGGLSAVFKMPLEVQHVFFQGMPGQQGTKDRDPVGQGDVEQVHLPSPHTCVIKRL